MKNFPTCNLLTEVHHNVNDPGADTAEGDPEAPPAVERTTSWTSTGSRHAAA
ncbi:MAG: hypothetical protein K8T90_05105 [Planctomycetes bacterium]|nr:hypothetical protein [Planctomycetota bacterium]